MFQSLPPLTGSAASAPAGFQEEPAAPVSRATLEELAGRVRVLESRVRALLAGFAILAVAAIIWPLVAMVVWPLPRGAAGKPATTTAPDPDPGSPPAGPRTDDEPLLPLK
jgi:hypothetical protein